MSNSSTHEHDLGLAHDLKVMQSRMGRRRALSLFGTVGTLGLVSACGGGGSSTTATATPPPPAAVTPPPPPPTSTAACTQWAAETGGPFPADGSNSSSGPTSNVLPVNGVMRQDIRASFLNSTTVAAGVRVDLTLTLVNVNNACAPLAGYAVYIWHTNREGRYSLYESPIQQETYLRGVQVSDANGRLSFTSIFPGCYAGRYPHVHIEVFSSLAGATSGNFARLVSQFAMPAATCTTVYNNAPGYTASIANFNATSIASDGVFRDNSAAQIAAQTLTMSGDITNGFTATATVGLAI